ncbi:hypothetical protein BOX15_Mlig012023g1, partial [Macrostomum lignano]
QYLVQLLLLLIQPVWPPHPLPASASTHWVASPDGGLPQPLPAEQSRLSMRRPADLAEWLRQWERLQLLDSLERELAESDATLESMPAKDDAFVEQFQRSNADCVAAGKPLQDLDLFVSVPLDPGLDLGAKPDTAWRAVSLLVPDCEAAMELPFSMDSLEHVASVRHRAELEAPPDIFLYRTAVPGGLTPDQYGHLIGEAMAANASSWHLHNMASYYWRIKGDAPRAAECALRALRLASHHSRDAVLLNLASLLHAAKRHSDALTVLRSALAINSRSQAAYMLLGNVLTLLADFPAALRAYQSALALPLSSPPAAEKQQQQQPATGDKKSGKAEKPSLPEATPSDSSLTSKAAPSAGAVLALRADAQRKAAAVRCQLGLESSLRQQNRQVGAAMARVQRFHARSEALARAKELAASEVAPLQARKASEAAYQEYLARHPSLSPAAQPTAAAASSSASSPSLQPSAADFSQPRRPPVHQAPRIDLPEALRYLVNASAFPSPSECRSHGETSGSDLQSVPSEHVPLENKGFESVAMLTDGLGIRIGDEHPLPWYPPDCSEFPDPQPSRLTGDHLEAVKLARAADPSVGQQSSASSSRHQQRQPMDGFASMQPEPAEPLLGGLSLRMHLDDLGQRLLTGLRSGRGGPQWALFTLAGAFWRVRASPRRSVDCLRRAIFLAPDNYRDVPLLCLAGMLARSGHLADAASLTADALAGPGALEPAVHAMHGHLLAGLSNYSGAEAHYLAAMRQDPERAADLTARLAAVRCQRRSAEAAGIGGHSASSPFDPDRPCRGRHACAELRAHFQEKICDLYSHYMQYSASECLAPANSIAFKVPHIHLLPRKDNSQAVIKGLLFNSDRSGAAADPSGADCVVFNDSSQSPGCQKLAAATAAAKVLAETVEFVNRLQRLIDRHAELLQAGRPPLSQLNLEGCPSAASLAEPEPPTWPGDLLLDRLSRLHKRRRLHLDFQRRLRQASAPAVSKNASGGNEMAANSSDSVAAAADMEANDTRLPAATAESLASGAAPACPTTAADLLAEDTQQQQQQQQQMLQQGPAAPAASTFSAPLREGQQQLRRLLAEAQLGRKFFRPDAEPVAALSEANKRLGGQLAELLSGLGLRWSDLGSDMANNEAEIARLVPNRRPGTPSSEAWASAALAALQHRRHGNHTAAFECLLTAHDWAPAGARHVALLGLAELLGLYDEVGRRLAFVLIDLAFAQSQPTAAGHMALANIHAGSNDWLEAAKHYEIAAALDPELVLAAERSEAIRCLIKRNNIV